MVCLRLALHLQGGMLNPETLIQHVGQQVVHSLGGGGTLFEDDMCSQYGFPGPERPNMKILHLADTGMLDQGLADGLHVYPFRHALHQHLPCGAQ